MDLTLFFLVLFVVYSLKVLLLDGQSCRDEQRSQRGFALLNSTYSSHFTDRYPDCLKLCVADPRCMSFNFWWYMNKCDLNNQSRKTCPACYVIEATATYQGMSSYPESLQNFKPESCSALKKFHPSLNSGSYVIDPDSEGGVPDFTVTCDMTDKNGVGVTVISYDSEDRTLVDGYESPGSYSRDVHYTGASLSQLASLTTVSSHCEQFIKYECHDAVLLYSGKHENYGWWMSRNSEKMTYWGGASPGSGKCACGMNNSCADPSYGCNCDKNDKVWREDSGLLTNKSHLPVSQLRFGDTGASYEQGYHTLGKFKCYGIAYN